VTIASVGRKKEAYWHIKSQIVFQFENAEKLFAMAGLKVTGPKATIYLPLLTLNRAAI
jgi:hypothetical protein